MIRKTFTALISSEHNITASLSGPFLQGLSFYKRAQTAAALAKMNQ